MTIPIEDQLSTVLTPVFGTEFYPIVHPDADGSFSSVSNLYAIYSIIGGGKFNKLDGNSDLSRVRVQISIYSMDYTEMKTKQRSLNLAMENANLLASQCVDSGTDQFEVEGAISNIAVSVASEDREEDTKRFFSHNEYYCWARG